jgi:hypothetical protein
MIRLASLVLLCAALTGALTACDDDDDGRDPTSPAGRASPTIAVPRIATPPPGADIRDVDIQTVPDVQELLTETGGQVNQPEIMYTDLTSDGFDEAIVPINSGGSLGYIAFIVLYPGGEGPQTLVRETAQSGGLALSVEDGVLVLRHAVPSDDDPECCPTLLRETRYLWNGEALAVASVETLPNPDVATATPTV